MSFTGKVRWLLCLAVTALAFVLLGSTAEAEEAVDLTATEGTIGESDRAYLIGSQNLLQIKIYGEGGVNQIYRVDEFGYITHGLVGRVKLGGMSVSAAEQTMEERLTGDYILNPQVTIFVIEHSRFSVLGEVRRPGNYEILGRITITEAIAMAGGLTPVGNARGIKIMRKNEEGESTVNVDLSRITEHGERTNEVYVEAGDVVVVNKSFF